MKIKIDLNPTLRYFDLKKSEEDMSVKTNLLDLSAPIGPIMEKLMKPTNEDKKKEGTITLIYFAQKGGSYR